MKAFIDRHSIHRACLEGYHDGKERGKDVEDRYHAHHPLWRYWWKAVVAATDTTTWGSRQVYEYCIGLRK